MLKFAAEAAAVCIAIFLVLLFLAIGYAAHCSASDSREEVSE
ncbi:MAG TPA: hypothetical protein VLI45_09270 [Acidobacteriaceae bacterium]|nr:hypothetical protein [Acidobacteriaceae bacterium]